MHMLVVVGFILFSGWFELQLPPGVKPSQHHWDGISSSSNNSSSSSTVSIVSNIPGQRPNGAKPPTRSDQLLATDEPELHSQTDGTGPNGSRSGPVAESPWMAPLTHDCSMSNILPWAHSLSVWGWCGVLFRISRLERSGFSTRTHRGKIFPRFSKESMLVRGYHGHCIQTMTHTAEVESHSKTVDTRVGHLSEWWMQGNAGQNIGI